MPHTVHNKFFDNASAVLIITSGIAVGAEVQYTAVNKTADLPEEFRALQFFFCIAFSLELIL